jgi:hypothetical protein
MKIKRQFLLACPYGRLLVMMMGVTSGEGSCLVAMLKVVTISELEIGKLATNNTGKGRSNVTVLHGEFRYSACHVHRSD